MLGRFYHIFVMNHRLELFQNCVVHLGGEPNVGLKQICQKFVCLAKFFSSRWCRCFSCKWTTSRIKSVFSLRVLISSLSWVILMVLKVDMAMAAMKIPMVMKHFGLPCIEISDFWGSALMMPQKSSREPSMIDRLTSVTNFVMDLKGSSCWSSSSL